MSMPRFKISHLARVILQCVLTSIVLFSIMGQHTELRQLYFIILAVNIVAIAISTLIVVKFKIKAGLNSLVVNMILAAFFFVAGATFQDQLKHEIIENVELEDRSVEPDGKVVASKVLAARVVAFSGWDFMWIYLIHAGLAYIHIVVMRGRQMPQKKKELTFSQDTFKVRLGNKVHFLPYQDIEFIEASGNYINVHTSGKKYTARMSVQDLLNQSDKEYLKRVHRSFAININLVRELVPIGDGQHAVVLSNGSRVKIGNQYKPEIFEHLGV